MNTKTIKKASKRGHAPLMDGQDHINIHPRARTALGRMLSSYRHMPFVHPVYGPFHSIEGFSHYLRSGCEWDSLRYVSGYRAKTLGREYGQSKKISNAEYQIELAYANYEKIMQNPDLLRAMISSELPFDSYYLFSNASDNEIVVETKDVDWVVQTFTEFREALKSGKDPESIAGIIEKNRVKQ